VKRNRTAASLTSLYKISTTAMCGSEAVRMDRSEESSKSENKRGKGVITNSKNSGEDSIGGSRISAENNGFKRNSASNPSHSIEKSQTSNSTSQNGDNHSLATTNTPSQPISEPKIDCVAHDGKKEAENSKKGRLELRKGKWTVCLRSDCKLAMEFASSNSF
jgi:hypothetical protein